MTEISMNRMMADLQRLASQAQAQAPTPQMNVNQTPSLSNPNEVDGFGALFSKAINEVNNLQMNSKRLKKAFEMGDPNVSLAQAMVASQKASVAFEATLKVREHLMKAYEEVMRMSV